MLLHIEHSLKELKWDKKKNKMIDKDYKKRLMMVEDFLLNLHARSAEVFKFCEAANKDFTYALPTLNEKDQHSEAYQKSLLYLEGIHQFADFMVRSKLEDIKKEINLKKELTHCKQNLGVSVSELKFALNERDLMKKKCKDIVKHTQMVHEKCKLKKAHYKEVVKENENLQTKNQIIENELKICESKITSLSENYENSKKYIHKMQKDLQAFKAKIHKMTIEIHLLEKINIEQSLQDENIEDKLQVLEGYLQSLKEHDDELHEHVSNCDGKERCSYEKKKNIDVSFKYEAAKNLIKRMQTTTKKKNKELGEKASEINRLKQEITDRKNQGCACHRNEVIDCDGILEENRRLWDGYYHLQLEQVSMEQDIVISERRYDTIRERLNVAYKEKQLLIAENEIHQEKIKEYMEITQNLKTDTEMLEKRIKELIEHSDTMKLEKARSDNEISQLKTFLDQQENNLKESDLKFISMENDYLDVQELLEDYKKSFGETEELLNAKTSEYEEKISVLSEELTKEKHENNIWASILRSPLLSSIVAASEKMEKLEECLENTINLKSFDSSNDVNTNDNYIENNNVLFTGKNEELQNEDEKIKLYEELKYKIEDLRLKCVDSIGKIACNADSKLEKYKMILFNEEDGNLQTEMFMPSGYEIIKLQQVN